MSKALEFLNSVMDEVAAEKGITREELEIKLAPKFTVDPLANFAHSSPYTEHFSRMNEGAWRYREEKQNR